ncbi:hypothetical protein ABZW10_31400 [Kitasatospora sp. NPDC004723]|uniref:hypothetical protein n=1 Tax=Kitasatospora sp. NPDC004723 TaxID=3154288 RepID=UPI0033BCBB80
MSEEPALSADERATLLATAMLDDLSAEDVAFIGGTVKNVLRQLESVARVEAAAELVALSEQVLTAAVAAERANGASWAAVGKALGISRSAAHGRFSGAVGRQTMAVERDDDGVSVRECSAAELYEQLRELWAKIADKAAQEQQLAGIQAAPNHPLSVLSAPTGSGKTAAAMRVIEALTAASGGGYINGPLVVSGPPGAGKTQVVAQAIEALRADHPDGNAVVVGAGRRSTAARLGQVLHAAGKADEASLVADLAGRTEDGTRLNLLRLQHDLAVHGASSRDAEVVDSLDVSPDVLATSLPPAREVTQQAGRVNRTEQRLTRLEAQLQMILDRLPEPPRADHDPELAGHRP